MSLKTIQIDYVLIFNAFPESTTGGILDFCRVGRGLPWLQAEVRFLRLPPGFQAAPLYFSHTFGCSSVPHRTGQTDLSRLWRDSPGYSVVVVKARCCLRPRGVGKPSSITRFPYCLRPVVEVYFTEFVKKPISQRELFLIDTTNFFEHATTTSKAV